MKYIVSGIIAIMVCLFLSGCEKVNITNEKNSDHVIKINEATVYANKEHSKCDSDGKNQSLDDQSQKKTAEENGIIVIPNSKKIKTYNENELFVCDYVLNEKFNNLEEIKNSVLNILKTTYIQDGWTIQPEVVNGNTITIIGNKPKKELFVVLIIKKVRKKNEVLVHSAINQDL